MLRRCALALTIVAFGAAKAYATPTFATEFERLAEVMGSLQFLSELCAEEDQVWRDEMVALIEVAEGTENWQTRVADRYNLGYSSFAALYRSCTPVAREAIDRYRALGARLAEEIARAFAEPNVPADADG